MTGTRRPLGSPCRPEGDNAPPGWLGYVARRDPTARPPRPRYRAWGTGKTTAEARAALAMIRDCARVLRGLPGVKWKRGRWPVDVAGAEPERVAGWRFFGGLPVAVVAGSTRPLAVLQRIMEGEFDSRPIKAE